MQVQKLSAALVAAGCVLAGSYGGSSAWAGQIVVHSLTGFAGDSFQGDAYSGVETDDYSVALNDAGDFLFQSIKGGGSSDALYKGNLHNPAAATRIVRVGDAYDQKYIKEIDQDGVRINRAGDFTFSAQIRTRSFEYADALFKNNRAILLPDDHIDGQDIAYMDEEGNDIDDSGRVAFFAEIQDPDPNDDDYRHEAIFFNGRLIVREGQTIAGQPIRDLRQNSELRLNNSGQMAYSARIKDAVVDENFQVIADGEDALFRTTVVGGVTSHAVVAKTGDSFSGYAAIKRIHESYLDQNEQGHIAFGATISELDSSGYDKQVIFVDDGSGPQVRFAPGMTLGDGSVIYRIDSSDGVLMNDVGDIVFAGSYDDGSEYGRRALFNQDGVLLVGSVYDNDGNRIGYGTQFGDYYVHSLSGEAWALNNYGQLLVGATFIDAAGNYSSGLVLIPEPAGVALLAIGGLLLTRRRA